MYKTIIKKTTKLQPIQTIKIDMSLIIPYIKNGGNIHMEKQIIPGDTIKREYK